MADLTAVLSALEQGGPQAAERLLPLVYDELRTLAARKLADEKPGQPLQATDLVHEAYLRLVDVEQSRRQGRLRPGGGRRRRPGAGAGHRPRPARTGKTRATYTIPLLLEPAAESLTYWDSLGEKVRCGA
jgi:hypothetical protein